MTFRAGTMPSSDDRSLERRICLLILVATPILFFLFLLVAPPVNPTFDDGKYIAAGRSFLDGHGPTVFGVPFLKHSPLWPVIVVLPERLLDLRPIAVGQFLNELSAAATIVLIGLLGWRVRPAIGALSAVLFAGLPYVFDLSRTAGIDLPSTALTLGYILIGMAVMKRGSLWLALLLGVVFAAAFDIKETILPFAFVPFLLGVMWGVPWATIIRMAAGTVAAAAIGTAWWFSLYASYEHAVYRLDLPDWTLLPGTIGIAVFVLVGLAARPIADWLHRRQIDTAIARRLPERLTGDHRQLLGWGLTLAWFVLLVIFFGRTPELLGASLFDPDQLRAFVGHSIWSERVAFAYALGGVLVAVELIRDRQRVAQASVDLLIALICGIPLVLLVAGVGDSPARHYTAVIALAILVATVGWYHGLLRLLDRDRPTIVLAAVLVALGVAIVGISTLARISPRQLAIGIGALVLVATIAGLALVWLWRHGRIRAAGSTLVALVFVVAMSGVGVRAVRLNGELDANEAKATADTIAWIKTNVGPGQTVALGPYLSTDTLIDLPQDVESVLIRHAVAIADPTAPLGLRSAGAKPADLVAIDSAPFKANQFDVYSAAKITQLIRQNDAKYWIYAARQNYWRSVLGLLTAERGFTEVATRTYRGTNDTIDVHVFRIDPSKLPVSADAIYLSADALGRLVDRLERDPAHGKVAAATLAARIVPPTDGSEDALITRLRTLATR